jgi:large-conductance mechanosensitive channel
MVGTFASALLNFILLFSAIFFLIQGAGFVDKAKGFGKYCKPDSPKKTDDDATNKDN